MNEINEEQWDQERSQKVPGNKWKWTHNNPKSLGHRESNPSREIHSITGLSQKQKIQINNLTLYLKEVEKEQQSTKWVEEGIIKIRAEVNEIESKIR